MQESDARAFAERLVVRITDGLDVKLRDAAQQGEAAARAACPEDSGKLSASISFAIIRITQGDWTFSPKAGTKYAAVQEYGGWTHPRVSEDTRKWAWATYKYGNRAKPYQGPGESVFWGIGVTMKAALDVYVPPSRFMLAGIRVVRSILEGKRDGNG